MSDCYEIECTYYYTTSSITISKQILEDFVLKGQNMVFTTSLRMDEFLQFDPKTNLPAFLA